MSINKLKKLSKRTLITLLCITSISTALQVTAWFLNIPLFFPPVSFSAMRCAMYGLIGGDTLHSILLVCLLILCVGAPILLSKENRIIPWILGAYLWFDYMFLRALFLHEMVTNSYFSGFHAFMSFWYTVLLAALIIFVVSCRKEKAIQNRPA